MNARRALVTVVVAGVLTMLLGTERAQAAPSVTFKCTPAPQNCQGWYRSDVAIDWTVTPSDATVVAGCQDRSLTTDTTGTNEFCKVDDGEATVTVELKIKLDKTAPVVVGGQPSRDADVNGWYNHPVAIAFSGSDLTSGIASCSAPTYAGPDSAAVSVSATCTDQAGNVSSPFPYGLRYDATAPAVTGADPAREPNAAGWFNRPVALALEGSDATSGIDACTELTYSGPESASGSFGGSCRDRAGNSASRSFPIKYDATAPVASGGQARRAPDRNGWHNHSVQVDFAGTDALSGVQGCTSVTYSGPDDATVSVPGTCTDRAGNLGNTVTVPLKYDATAPLVSPGVPGRGPDLNGWYNHPVSVAFGGSDPMSGLDSCTAPTYSGPDGATAALAGTCTDRAGNVSAPLAHALKYDATAPVVSGATPERGANADGWFNRPVRFDLAAGDATSGIGDCPPVTYSGPDSATASFGATCRDRAGNAASRSFPLKYDATAPEATRAVPDRAANAAGWYSAPVTVGFEGSDATSGVSACTRRSYSGPDSGSVSLTGTCTDRAGNSSEALGFGLRYDATAPAIDTAEPGRPADANGWYNHPVSFAFGGTDGLSGVDSCTAATYAGPDTATATLSGTCSDRAGNSTGPLSVGFKYDATAPEVLSAQPERQPDANGWFNRAVAFAIEGSDAMSGIEACPTVTYEGPDGAAASVIGRCRDRAANLASRAFPLRFDATAPAIADLAATAADRSVALSWRTSPDAESVGVRRTPGVGLEPSSLVFGGPGTSFVDGSVDNGVRYAYEVRVQDPAGNVRSESVSAVPFAPPVQAADAPALAVAGGSLPAVPAGAASPLGARLLAPPAGAVFAAGARPLLRWTPVPGASYYNLQLLRGGKVLTAWPAQPQYRLPLRWRHGGRRHRLRAGEYHWIVWPGFGQRSRADYGRRIGRRSFVVRAPGR